MQKKYKLASRLCIITSIAFWFLTLFSMNILFFDIFTSNGKIGNFYSASHHSKGYPIKAKIQFKIPDSTIIYNGIDKSGSIVSSDHNKMTKEFKTIKADKNLIKTYQINKISAYNGLKKMDSLNRVSIEGSSAEIDIIFNPKDTLFKLILIFKTYVTLLTALFVLFQLKNLFKTLNQNFKFSLKLNNYIKKIGYALLTYQIIKILISVLILQFITRIEFNHFIPSIKNSNFNFMSLYLEIDFNLMTIFVGLSLIILSKLLKYGYEIQEESELMI